MTVRSDEAAAPSPGATDVEASDEVAAAAAEERQRPASVESGSPEGYVVMST